MIIYIIKDVVLGEGSRESIYIPIEYIEYVQLGKDKNSVEPHYLSIQFMSGNDIVFPLHKFIGCEEEQLKTLKHHFNTILKLIENLKYTSREIEEISASAKTIGGK